MTNNVVCWSNDVISFAKEVQHNDVTSMPKCGVLLMFCALGCEAIWIGRIAPAVTRRHRPKRPSSIAIAGKPAIAKPPLKFGFLVSLRLSGKI